MVRKQGHAKDKFSYSLSNKKTEQLNFVEDLQAKYYDDPIGFIKQFFPQMTTAPNFKWQSEELLKYGACKGLNQYAYVGCTGSGKSTLICLTIIWLLVTRNAPKMAVITSTAQQSTTTIFDTLATYLKNSDIGGLFGFASNQITLECNENNVKNLCFSDSEDGDKSNSLRGLHSTDSEAGITAVFMDEAGNFGEWVYQKLVGIMATGNSLWILSSNGGKAEGGFYKRFSTPDYGFIPRRITAWDIGMDEARIQAMKVNYGGEDSDMYQHMILANFTGAESSAITLQDIEASVARYNNSSTDSADSEIYMGLDLSAKTSGKSKNCLCIRNSTRVLLWELVDANPKEIFEHAKNRMDEYKVKYCFFDASSILGTFFTDIARDHRFVRFLPQQLCKHWQAFLNKRSECIFRMMHWIKKVGAVPFDNKLTSVFCAVENIVQNSNQRFGMVGAQGGKIRHTPKSELERVGDKQTVDKFDALSYTFQFDQTNVSKEIFEIKDSTNIEKPVFFNKPKKTNYINNSSWRF